MATRTSGTRAWTVVVVTGILAAMHVWKLPSALEYIRADLALTSLPPEPWLGSQLAGALGGLPPRSFLRESARNIRL